jgi:hypothetical protein
MKEEDLRPIINPLTRNIAESIVSELKKNNINIDELGAEEYEDLKKKVNILLGEVTVHIDDLIKDKDEQ